MIDSCGPCCYTLCRGDGHVTSRKNKDPLTDQSAFTVVSQGGTASKTFGTTDEK